MRTIMPSRLLLLFLACFLAVPVRARAEDAPSAEPAAVGEAPILSTRALEYRPGRGLRIGSTGLVVGGFTNVKAETVVKVDQTSAEPEGEALGVPEDGAAEASGGAEFTLDTLNFFVIFDRFARFRAVAELQLKDIFVADEERAGTHDFAFDVRRLFGDFTVADPLHVRAGTFLTPVGYWNLILAPPLTWTTEPPLIVEEVFFQQTTTGLMLHGTTGVPAGRLGYSLFSQFLKPLEDDPDLEPPDHTAGLQLTYDTGPLWSVGGTYQAAENDGEWSHLGGLHLVWRPRRGEILTEAYVQDDEDLSSSQWGAYVQGVLEVYGPLYLVGRYEHFNPLAPERTLNVFTIGGVWKPFPFMALKVEYRIPDHTPEEDLLEGFFSSFTTFF